MVSLTGIGNGNVATSGQTPTAATSLAAGPTPVASPAPTASTALAVPATAYAGQVPDTTSNAPGSKPVIQDKISTTPGKVDKIGTAVDIAFYN